MSSTRAIKRLKTHHDDFRSTGVVGQSEDKSNLSNELLEKYHDITDTKDITEPTLENINCLLKRHTHAFAYSTLAANLADVALIADATSLANYLIENRSGLCFHHCVTFCEVLKSLGCEAHLVACFLEREDTAQLYPIATHAGIVCTLQGKRYYVDPGTGVNLNDIIPFDLSEPNKARYEVVNTTADRFEIRKKKRKGYILVFDDMPRPVSYFQAGLNILRRPDSILEDNTLQQGHDIYSHFRYAKFNGISLKYHSVSAYADDHDTTAVSGSVFDNIKTFFTPSASELRLIATGKFVNPVVKDLLFEEKVPEVFQRSSCQSLRR